MSCIDAGLHCIANEKNYLKRPEISTKMLRNWSEKLGANLAILW